MRYVAIALVLLTLPIFMSLLRQYPRQRGLAFVVIGLLLFVGGTIRIDATLVGWPMWNGLYKGMEFTPLDTMAVAVLLTRAKRPTKLPFLWLFALYGGTLLFSIFFASVPMATTFAWWHYARLILLFVAVAGEVARPDMRGGLLNGLSLGLMLQAGYVIWEKLHGVVQATGTMFHQNTLGMMVELALLPLVAALLAGERHRLVPIGTLAGLIVVVGGGSRATLGMMGGGIVLLALISLVRQVTPAKLKIVGIGLLALALVTPLGLMTLKERFGSNSVITEEAERAAFERAATAMAAEHPFGVGANLYVPVANMQGYAARAGVAWNFANRSAPVHNAYLLARAETGWLGQIAYMLLLFWPVLRGLRFAFSRRKGPEGDLVLGAAIALGVLGVHNLYEFAGLAYGVLAVGIVNISLIASLSQASAVRPNRSRSRPPQSAPPSIEPSHPLSAS